MTRIIFAVILATLALSASANLGCPGTVCDKFGPAHTLDPAGSPPYKIDPQRHDPEDHGGNNY